MRDWAVHSDKPESIHLSLVFISTWQIKPQLIGPNGLVKASLSFIPWLVQIKLQLLTGLAGPIKHLSIFVVISNGEKDLCVPKEHPTGALLDICFIAGTIMDLHDQGTN